MKKTKSIRFCNNINYSSNAIVDLSMNKKTKNNKDINYKLLSTKAAVNYERNMKMVEASTSEKLNLSEIGKRFGISKQRVKQIFDSLGYVSDVPGPNTIKKEKKKEKFIELIKNNKTKEEAAKELGLSKSTMYQYLKEASILLCKKKINDEKYRHIMSDYRDGLSSKELSVKYNYTVGSVRVLIRRLKQRGY